MSLIDTGLDSVGFAKLVTRLEEEWGVDPFSVYEEEIGFPVTLDDLVALYEAASERRLREGD